MSEEQRVLTPFEIGVCAALQVIGLAIASLDPAKRLQVIDAAKGIINSLPADKSVSFDKSAHHLALEALIQGLSLEKSQIAVN